MRRHARRLRGDLERGVTAALAEGSVIALVAMAFFAVIREGFESAVFLLAAFDASSDPVAASSGAVLGFVAATLLGWGIYRGGVRFDLVRFFRVTGVILVLVAAGLLASAAHSAWEAGWVTSLQGQALDLTWLVEPGSVRSALLTGMLGLQPRPTELEVLVYVVFAVPMLVYVLWRGGSAAAACAARLERCADGTGRVRLAAARGGRARRPVRPRRLRLRLEVGRHEDVLVGAQGGRGRDHRRRL